MHFSMMWTVCIADDCNCYIDPSCEALVVVVIKMSGCSSNMEHEKKSNQTEQGQHDDFLVFLALAIKVITRETKILWDTLLLKAKGFLFCKIYTSVKTQFCSFASVYHHSGFLRLSTLSQWI